MQTFLPYPDLRVSCQVLDDKRLGKQRVETFQVLRALTWPQYAWKNHPAVRMWRGFVPGLVAYGLESCVEWTRRGYADTVAPQLLGWTGGEPPEAPELPPWFGLAALHLSHRSALLRKDPAYYRPLFAELGDGDDPDDLPYLWPPDVWPRWPVRAGTAGLPTAEVALQLGLPAAHPWQDDAVEALHQGRDVLLVARPGTGGSTTGLLAALSLPGRALVVRPWGGAVAPPAPEHVPLPPPRELPERGAPARGAADDASAARPSQGAADDGADPAPSAPAVLARPPGPADVLAMAAESAPPEVLFAHPDGLPPADALESSDADLDVRLVVLDGADALALDEVAAVRRLAGPRPLLTVVDRAPAPRRRALLAALERPGLSGDCVLIGGGYDPAGTRLEVRRVTTAGRRAALADAVRGAPPALVVAATRQRADRLLTGLLADGLRAAVWAPPPMRAARAAEAVGAWRRRRLDALVVPAGELPPLGRIAPRALVGDAAALPAAEDWWALVDAVAPPLAVLLADPAATPALDELAQEPGCRRAALLEPFGEPVAVPCGRCDVCAPVSAAVGAPVSGAAAAAGAGPRPAARRGRGSHAG